MWTSLEDHYSADYSLSLETPLETSLNKLLSIWGCRHPIHLTTISATPDFYMQILNECLLPSRYNVCGITQTYQTQLPSQGY